LLDQGDERLAAADPEGGAPAPHLCLSRPGTTAAREEPAEPLAAEFARQGKLWRPRRVLITPEAYALPYGRAMLERAVSYGAEVVRLRNNRLPPLLGEADRRLPVSAETDRKKYAAAKTTFAIVVSPPGQRKLQPIPPSADWQFHVAQGCPAHCQYCYLAGSLAGPPVTRAYANLPEILEGLRAYVGTGQVTSKSRSRAQEGTTFEASCYTDPLGIEHLTGALEESIRFFGAWHEAVQLRWTTKFDAVDRLLGLEHRGRTRVRFSINAATIARDFEGGTANVAQRLGALRKMAMAGYPVGLTIAPIMPVPEWQGQYTALLTEVAEALRGVEGSVGGPGYGIDLTVELITHRFTPGSKEVLLSWYPKTTLDLREDARAEKRTKFGGFKYVYPKDAMGEMRRFFARAIGEVLPSARILYWT
jgi:spore photoproduct lyase